MSRSPAEPRGRGLGLPTLSATLAVVILAGCAATPSPSPTGPPPTSPPASATVPITPPAPTTSATPGPSRTPVATPDFTGFPVMLVARDGPAGTTVWKTAPGDPTARIAVALPAGPWRADAASGDGQRIAFTALTGPTTIMTARLTGTAAVAEARRALPVGLLGDDPRSGFVACVSPAGDVLVADAGVGLHLLSATGRVGPILPAATLGSCAWRGKETVLFDIEGSHHLGLWRVGAAGVAMSDLKLSAASAAGTTVAAVSNDGEAGRAVVLSVPDPPGGTFQPAVMATLRPAEGEAYAGVRLSADGRWLVAWGGMAGDAIAWLDAYRRTDREYVLVGRTAFRADDDVRAVMAAP